MAIIAERIKLLGTENAFKVGGDIKAVEQSGMNVIKLNLGEPDFNSADNINAAAHREIDAGNSHYCDPGGLEPFRQTIARQIAETRDIPTEADRVVVTPGAKPPISYTMLAYVNPGDEVIYPSPGFPIYESWITFVGAKPVPLHLEEEKGFSFSAGDLEQLITPKTKVIIINSPSNPTGGVIAESDLREIAEVIQSKAGPEVRVYSDEVYEYILFDGSRHVSIASMPGMAGRTVLVSGHSKTFAMTGWRLGYALLPTREEADLFKTFNVNIISCTPPFIQMAGKAALENEENKGIIADMVRNFEERRNYVVDALNAIDGVTCAKPTGAFYVFPNIAGVCESLGGLEAYGGLPDDIKARTSPSTLFQMFTLYTYGVATMDRKSFGQIGIEGKHYLRLSTATDLDSLKEGVKRLEAASRDRDGFRAFMEKGEHLY